MGSSPRVRGAGSKVLHNAHIIGIIPACAGSSCAHASTFLFGWDHPRACGEQVNKEREEMTSQGSSPRMRGTAEECLAGVTVDGIIPAHAGNSRTSSCASPRCWDHPRACGEQHTHVRKHSSGNGIIPARAGSSSRCAWHSSCCRDHPRACGEQQKVFVPTTA